MSRPAIRVFAYGTLMFPEVVEALLGRTFASRPATLSNFARLSIRGRVYPGIVARPGSETEGILYEEVDEASLATLDAFEGEMYERTTVAVLTPSGKGGDETSLAAEAYVVAASHRRLLAEEPWDPEAFRALHHERYVEDCRELRARGGAVNFDG